MGAPRIFIHQILPHYHRREDLDPAYLVLDNSARERPDWYEYWPIRKFLLNETLDDDAFYGFLSPKFQLKTNLSAAAARDFIGHHGSAADVILLSRSIHLACYFLNTFQYGDALHPGLLAVAARFFDRIGQPTDLRTLITTSGNEVYSNFFVAKPRFWREWLVVNEQLFAIAESPTDPLGAELRAATAYRGRYDAPMKIFIVERIATWILARDSSFKACVREPFAAPSRRYKLPVAVACDALKLTHLATGREAYLEIFRLFSRCGRFLSWEIRIGSWLGIAPVRACLDALSSYWDKVGRA